MTQGAKFPPVVVFHDGNHHYLADGFHRTMAAQRNGLTEIPADIRKGTQQDALWFALGANREHAHRMTPADKRHAILLALQTWPERSINQIAAQIGVNQRYASGIKSEVSATTNLPSRVTGKDGKSYPASRPVRQEPSPRHHEPVEAAPRTHPAREPQRVAGPPANGMQFARLAIMRLSEIADDDTERLEAFLAVEEWISENR